jgi:predicted glutamine amidotransferase
MCELLGMSANVPTDICFSFTGLMKRGGQTGPHRDGWGISFYEGRRCRTFHDVDPSAQSPIAELIHRYPIKSQVVISHIRQATHGTVCLENTHPFTRELWGRAICFAHNGQLRRIKSKKLGDFRPVGSTDSEHAFCWLMSQARDRWQRRPPSLMAFANQLESWLINLAEHGTCNILMSDSRALYVFCTTHLSVLTRCAPFAEATLIDTELTVNFKEETTPNDIVTVLATHPLTEGEGWMPLEKGKLHVFVDGSRVR